MACIIEAILLLCFCITINKLKLVMQGNKLELWIALLTTWNVITVTVQSNHRMLIINKHCAIFTNLYSLDTLY